MILHLLERRQHLAYRTVDSWPNRLLLELCDFSHARMSPEVTIQGVHEDCSDTARALKEVRLAARSQLPGARV